MILSGQSCSGSVDGCPWAVGCHTRWHCESPWKSLLAGSGCHVLIRGGAVAIISATPDQVADSSVLPHRTLLGSETPERGCFRAVWDRAGNNSALSARTAPVVRSFWRRHTTLEFSSSAGTSDLESRGHDHSIIRCTEQPT